MSRPLLSPSPPPRIQTTKQQAKPLQHAPSSSSQQPYTVYPIPIPPDKHAKALELYRKYKFEEVLSQSDRARHHNSNYQYIPEPPTTLSTVASQASLKRRVEPSTLDSGYYSSVVSSDQIPSYAASVYDGKKVHTRKRRKLGPTAGAKAALVRYLGSCAPCRTRRVAVSYFVSIITLKP
jgi:ubiquitin C-terminal hydrolase